MAHNEPVGVWWFSSGFGSVGIVVVEDKNTRERRAYISPVAGNNEDTDKVVVQEIGGPVAIEDLQMIISALKKEVIKDENGTGGPGGSGSAAPAKRSAAGKQRKSKADLTGKDSGPNVGDLGKSPDPDDGKGTGIPGD